MELTRSSAIDRLQSKLVSVDEFNFDRLSAPPLYSLLTQYDIDNLYRIATSVRYSGNPRKKYKAIDDIMKARGFVKLSAGTNRVVYRFLEDDRFVIKVAADAVGIKDNPKEFINQHIFKPFVTKVFEVSPCGTVGLFERVNPITSREEFASVADDIFDVINNWFIGEHVMADIGTKFFMNWAIRTSFGPVLLDFPYVYELDGNKLYCSAPNDKSETGRCDGVIDYDDGFNFLVCQKCGVRYRVNELAKSIKDETIIVKGRRTKRMRVSVTRNGVNIKPAEDNIDKVLAPESTKVQRAVETKPAGSLKVGVTRKEVTKKSGKKNFDKKSDYRKPQGNGGQNRGMVRSNASNTGSTLKVSTSVEVVEPEQNLSVKHFGKPIIEDVPVVKLEVVNNGKYSVSELDMEHGLVIFTNDEDNRIKVAVEIKKIPEEDLLKMTGLLSVKEDLEAELEVAKNDLNATEIRLENEKKARIELYSSYERLEKQIKEIQESADDAETPDPKCSCESIKAENSSLKSENERLRADVARLTDELTEVGNDLAVKISAHEEYVAMTDADKAETAKKLSSIEKNMKKFENIIKDKDDDIRSLQAKLEAAQKALADVEAEKSELEAVASKAIEESKISALDSVCEALSIANSALERSIVLSEDTFDFESNEEYLSNLAGVQVIYGNLVPISSICSNGVDPERDYNVIIFPNGPEPDDGYSTDQTGNIIAVLTVDDMSIEGFGTSVIPSGEETVVSEEVVEE